jgi:hypothetical protein
MEIIWREINETTDLKSCSKLLSKETPARNQISGLINLVGYGQKHFSGTEDGKGVRTLCSICKLSVLQMLNKPIKLLLEIQLH